VTRAFLKRVAHDPSAVDALGADDQIWGTVDSLHVLALVQHLEQTYEIKVRPIDLTPENFASIRAVARFITGQKQVPA
jgi:acyl carrier protein